VKQVLDDTQKMPRTRFTFAIVLKEDKAIYYEGEIEVNV